MRNDPFDLTSRPPVIGRIVGATITLVCVLIVYDGWAALELLDVVFIVVGPIVAFFTSHIFSSSLVQQVQLGRRPTMQERLATARFESRFLLLAVPPLGVLLVLRVANVTLTDSVQVVIWLEALSLSFWAGLAAWYAGLRGRSLALSILGGLVVSIIVLSLQVFLQPGKAVNNGEAAPAEPSGAVVLVTAADSTCSPTTESDGPARDPSTSAQSSRFSSGPIPRPGRRSGRTPTATAEHRRRHASIGSCRPPSRNSPVVGDASAPEDGRELSWQAVRGRPGGRWRMTRIPDRG